MNQVTRKNSQSGFSLLELLIVVAVMAVVTGAVVAMMKDGMKVSSTTFELVNAQESLRTAHEYINRDVTQTGDGLKNVSPILIPRLFVTTYLTRNAFLNTLSTNANVVDMGLVTSDNDVPSGTAVAGSNPAVNVYTDTRTSPATPTDRVTILANDPSFNQQMGAISVNAADIDLSGTAVRLKLTSADFNRANFKVGEIYFITSQAGGTFGTITDIQGGGNPRLVFDTGDTYNLNTQNLLNTIVGMSGNNGTLPVSIMRMRIIHYYVNSGNLLVRRVFGVANAGFTDNVIAEHVTNMQVRFTLNPTGAGAPPQPVSQITDSVQLKGIRQAEFVVTAETTHAVGNQNINGTVTPRSQALTMTTSVSIRNMQFREALQPTSTNGG
ncbi:MAG: type II secretion system protein [Pyrinomonadaceae bacterium]